MDAAFLKESVGEALAAGLAQVSAVNPDDAVDYLGNFLLKYVENKKAELQSFTR